MSEVVSILLGYLAHGWRVAILGIVLIFAVSSRSVAQQTTWTQIAKFDRSIGCGYFFDNDHGLIGSGVRPGLVYDSWLDYYVPWPGDTVAIYRTTDGGVSWSATQLPRSITGAVTSISMIDSLEGYASIFSDYSYDYFGTFGRSALWHTTDGGITWTNALQLDHLATSVYAQHGLLMFTKWDSYYQQFYDSIWYHYPLLDTFGGYYSYDNGATWTKNFRRGNGIAFADSLHGVVSEMNSNTGGANFWSTSDAGRSWQPTSTQYESWSVYAVKGTSMFFCANESQPDLPHRSVNWSTDGGQTWSIRTLFPSIHFTGTINGVGSTLYLQTDSGSSYFYNLYYSDPSNYQYGLYRSDDLGANWHWVGGPSNSRDTRFVVTGCEGEVVYAFDGVGGVWKTIDGGDGTLTPRFTFDSDSLVVTPNACGDTIAFGVLGGSCNPVFIDSASVIFGTELTPLNASSSLPKQLTESDRAELRLQYTPTKSGKTTSLVRVWGHAGSRFIKRDLTVITQNDLPDAMYLSRDTSHLEVGACGTGYDTIYLSNLGCPGLTIDSVTVPPGEVGLVSQPPLVVPSNDSLPLYFSFAPDSAGDNVTTAHIYAHDGARSFDTILSIVTKSVWAPLNFRLDSTSLSFSTKYCFGRSAGILIATTGCDTVFIDSVVSSNPSFIPQYPGSIGARTTDTLAVIWNPDSVGATSGTIHLYGHDKQRRLDTIISLSGMNVSLPQSVVLSRTAIPFATSACQPIGDSLWFTNQGCADLHIDSIFTTSGEVFLTYDTLRKSLRPNDSTTLKIGYAPSDGTPKIVQLHVRMHTSKRTIDTTVVLSLSNAIPARALALSSDSLYLFTKYCQPTSSALLLSNFGCPDLLIDSLVVVGDSLHEFAVATTNDTVRSQQQERIDVGFAPSVDGTRNVTVRLYGHAGENRIDTMLTLTGKNLTAPVPFIGPIPTAKAGETVEIPIMLAGSADTFSIGTYAFHLIFNTDLLTPNGLDFAGTGSRNVLSSSWTQDANGVSGRVTLGGVIADTSSLALPLLKVIAKVSLAKDTTTQVILDTFVTDREPAMTLCSIPSQPFVLSLVCGDPLLLQVLRSQTPSINFISVVPNPATGSRWRIAYDVKRLLPALTLRLYSADGRMVWKDDQLPSRIGEHEYEISAPVAEGDYFLVLGSDREECARKGSVVR